MGKDAQDVVRLPDEARQTLPPLVAGPRVARDKALRARRRLQADGDGPGGSAGQSAAACAVGGRGWARHGARRETLQRRADLSEGSTSQKTTGNNDLWGYPTGKDRVMQAIVKAALKPAWEARFEANSYGFRPGRCTMDAVTAIHTTMSRRRSRSPIPPTRSLADAFRWSRRARGPMRWVMRMQPIGRP